MSDIGPGDWVQAVESDASFGIIEGAIYVVSKVHRDVADPCDACMSPDQIHIQGRPRFVYEGREEWGLCPCTFRKWPPPADAALLSEDVDTDVKEPV